jgi:hypothetical protein
MTYQIKPEKVSVYLLVFFLSIVPSIYTEVALWARIGDIRLIWISALFLFFLVIPHFRVLGGVSVVSTALIVFYISVNIWSQDFSLTPLTWVSLISALAFFFAGALSNHRSIDNSLLLPVALVFLDLIVMFNAISVERGIYGLNFRSDVYKFNYLLPSYLVVGLFYVVIMQKRFALKSNFSFFVVLLTFVSLWCAGSRFTLIVFLLLLGFLFYKSFRFEKEVRINCLIKLMLLCAVAISVVNFSTASVNNRYVANLLNDRSVELRLQYALSDIKHLLNLAKKGNPDELNLNTQGDKSSSWLMSALFGLKVANPEAVRLSGYNHTVYEVIKNYGLVFFALFLYVSYKGFRQCCSKSDCKLLPLYFLSIGTFFVASDIYELWWYLVGLALCCNEYRTVGPDSKN